MPENENSWPEVLLTSSDENAKRIYEKDWSENPLGPIENWSPSFITILTTAMGSQFPALILWGPDFITFFNVGYGSVLGDKQYWALGKPLQQVWPEAWDSLYGMLKGVIATGKGSWAEDQIYYLNRNGYPEQSYFTFSFARIIDVRGGFGGILCTAIETTQKVISERRLKALGEIGNHAGAKSTVKDVCRESLAVLKQLTDDIPFAVLRMISTDGSSAEICGSFGMEAPIVSLNLSENNNYPILNRVLESGASELIAQLPSTLILIPGQAGLDPVRSAFVMPIKISVNSTVCGFLTVGISPHLPFDEFYRTFLDLVARQISSAIGSAKMQEEAHDRAIALAELDHLKTTFFSNVSHEFRTPLTLLLGPLEDAMEQAKGTDVSMKRDALQSIYRNALRLLKLVNSLLDFSRMETGRVEASFEPVDLPDFTKELAGQFRSVIEKGNLEFVVKADPIAEPVYIDCEMWEKIVLNLLSNAFKFTFYGSVKVQLKDLPQEIELSVQDSGIGISKDELPKIFERFHRVEGARSRTFEGSGIGMALVYDMVKVQYGKITVESEEGNGTCFRVTIPKGKVHIPPAQIKREKHSQSTRLKSQAFVEEASRWVPETDDNKLYMEDKATILIVDDNADMRDYLFRMLNHKYNVLAAGNGLDALEMSRVRVPDLVISDIMMPEMNGFELLKSLRKQENTSRLPIILLSARAGNEATIEGLEAGADDYLVKPFSGKELLARVKTQLSMTKLRSDLESERRALLVRDDFLSIASHELNTPVTPLKIQLQLLTRALEKGTVSAISPERMKMTVQVLERQVNKISSLVRDMLDVAHISHGTMTLTRQKTDLNRIINRVVVQYSEQIVRAKCTVTLDLKENMITDSDTIRIEQVVTNLLTNSMKYASGTPIKISSYSRNKIAVLTVEDNGPGISKQDLEKIFDRYERLDASPNLGGLGLGLYITKQIVDAHGGRIRVESTKGIGTKFFVELPAN